MEPALVDVSGIASKVTPTLASLLRPKMYVFLYIYIVRGFNLFCSLLLADVALGLSGATYWCIMFPKD